MTAQPSRLRWAALALAALLVGCPGERPVPTAGGAAAPNRAGATPRVVTAAPALAEMICAIDGREHLVGVSRWCVYPPELRGLPDVGGILDPNLEVIGALAPDLVLVQGRSELVEQLAARRGFSVERFEVETLSDLFTALGRLGALLGRERAAAREVARLERALTAARAAAPAEPPDVLLVLHHRPGELGTVSAAGPDTFISEALEAAGGRNCLGDLVGRRYPTLPKELVLERAPDLIIELHVEPVDAGAAALLRADWAPLTSVPAVAAGRIAFVAGEEVLVPGPRLDVLLAKLQAVLARERGP